MKILLILGIICLIVMIFMFGAVAHASSNIPGLADLINGIVDVTGEGVKGIVDIAELVAEHYWG